MDDSSRVCSVVEAGRILGLGRSAAYEAVRRGDIPAIRIGKRIVVSRARLASMLGEEAPQAVDPRPAA